MFIRIKSKTQLQDSSVQTISLAGSQLFKKTGVRGSVQVVQSSLRIFQLVAIIVATLFFSSCQKEQLSDPALNSTSGDLSDLEAKSKGNADSSKVDAGRVAIVVYPSSASATLSGKAPGANGPKSDVKWKQVDGPSNAAIDDPTKLSTKVNNLKPGVYTFVLTVTDDKGNSGSDTTYVTVLLKMTWTIEGVEREALVHPAKDGSGRAPIVFAFHGHGGTDIKYAQKGFELTWPEAIVVYTQGLRTKSGGDNTGRQPGWQSSVGEVNSFTGIKDQDLKYFDAMLSTLKNKYSVNSIYIFAHGWSNGGEFVYNVLWAARGNQLAALAPAGSALGSMNGKNPLPIIHTAGTKDDKVPFGRQQKTVDNDRDIDNCSSNGTTWATGPDGLLGTQYTSRNNTPVVMLQYNDGHRFPDTVPPLIMNFFKQVAGVK